MGQQRQKSQQRRNPVGFLPACLACGLLLIPVAHAQERLPGVLDTSPDPVQNSSGNLTPILNVERRSTESGFQNAFADELVNLNLGVEYKPVDSLSLRADAWRVEADQAQVQASFDNGIWSADDLPGLYIEDSVADDFHLQEPFSGNRLEANGIDLGASYVWDTDNLGQFTLSTRASYMYDFNQQENLPANQALTGNTPESVPTPELQGSLMLTWQFGNHSASAVTNYFDSFKDIDELNLDEINELVNNITTFDLSYGYTVKTGKHDRSIISFDIGIRNIFDEKTTQILNQNSRVLDQNGRVAYGSIKYQF